MFVLAFKVVATLKSVWKRLIVGLKPVQLLKMEVKAAGGVKLAPVQPETVVSQPLWHSLY